MNAGNMCAVQAEEGREGCNATVAVWLELSMVPFGSATWTGGTAMVLSLHGALTAR